MTHPDDLLDGDPDLELLLRTRFASDAADAVVPRDLHALGDDAIRRGRAHRRRTAAAGAALSAVVLVGGVLAVDALDEPRSEGSVPAASAPSVPSPGAPSPSVLMFRGVEVAVPRAMLDPDAVRCGTAVRDAAYVVDNAIPVEACLIPARDDLTTVVMQPLEDLPPQAREAGGRTLPDGRWEVTSAIPGRDVWLTVTSPDQQLAQRFFDTATIVDAPAGCPVHQVPAPVRGTGEARISVPLSGAAVGRVCGYRNGWLTGATGLSHQQAVQLADLVESTPADPLLDCTTAHTSTGGWWLDLGDNQVWVGDGCPQVVGYAGGTGLLTSRLVSQLWSLAAGPGSFGKVVSSKG